MSPEYSSDDKRNRITEQGRKTAGDYAHLGRLYKGISVAGLVLSVILCIWGWQAGIFSDQGRLQDFIAGFGSLGMFVFIVFQAVQVVVPVIPGGLSCLAGVILFGAWKGFLCNYIGICAGSVIAFLIAKQLGRPLMEAVFKKKPIEKYENWTTENNRFTKLFALAIFLPFAPDDFLCYLAGTTKMKLGSFTGIILAGKPAAIALYSLGLMTVFSHMTSLIGG